MVEHYYCSRKVAGSSLEPRNTKCVKMVLVVSSLDAQRLEDTIRTGCPGVRIMWDVYYMYMCKLMHQAADTRHRHTTQSHYP